MMYRDYFKALLQYILPKRIITTLAGLLARVETPMIKHAFIRWFIWQYKVDMSEAIHQNIEDYRCFNDFFTRHLKPSARPVDKATLISPVDGYISTFGDIKAGQLIQAKRRNYTVQALLACDEVQADMFSKGKYATLYLSPKDYHRVHMPVSGTLKEMIYIPGKLFSVQPATTRMIPYLFARNERVVSFFETSLGMMAMVLVGATIVGGIQTSWHGEIMRKRKKTQFIYPQDEHRIDLTQGSEMGYFQLGSTVILLFANDWQISWQEYLKNGQSIRVGTALANTIRT